MRWRLHEMPCAVSRNGYAFEEREPCHVRTEVLSEEEPPKDRE